MAAIVAMVLLLSAGYEIFSSNLYALLHPDGQGFEHAHLHVHFNFKQNKKLIVTFGGIIVAAYALSGVYIVGAVSYTHLLPLRQEYVWRCRR